MPPKTGRLVAGRYRLLESIGRGAMGVVWRATDELLGREVAVKEVRLNPALGDIERANAYKRTLREARTAARLSHRGVVTIFDVVEEDGRPWIIMELIRSRSLDEILGSHGQLPPRRAARVAQQLLSALAHAHAAGVLHRDVKPSNVLIASNGHDERAVLTDFGIAQFKGDPRLTQTGMVMGSPGFTAPERIRGGSATPASDLWSLGATIFAACEGHGPYENRGGAITTMSAIINEDAPSAKAAGKLGPVIAALLCRDPARRPSASSAASLIHGLLPTLPDAPAGRERTPTALSSIPRRMPPAPASRTPDVAATGVDLPQPGPPAAKVAAGLNPVTPSRTGRPAPAPEPPRATGGPARANAAPARAAAEPARGTPGPARDPVSGDAPDKSAELAAAPANADGPDTAPYDARADDGPDTAPYDATTDPDGTGARAAGQASGSGSRSGSDKVVPSEAGGSKPASGDASKSGAADREAISGRAVSEPAGSKAGKSETADSETPGSGAAKRGAGKSEADRNTASLVAASESERAEGNATGDSVASDDSPGDKAAGDGVTGDVASGGGVTGDVASGGGVTADVASGGGVTADDPATSDVLSGSTASADSASGDTASGDSASGDSASGEAASAGPRGGEKNGQTASGAGEGAKTASEIPASAGETLLKSADRAGPTTGAERAAGTPAGIDQATGTATGAEQATGSATGADQAGQTTGDKTTGADQGGQLSGGTGRSMAERGNSLGETGNSLSETGKSLGETGKTTAETVKIDRDIIKIAREAAKSAGETVKIDRDTGKITGVGKGAGETAKPAAEIGRMAAEAGKSVDKAGKTAGEADQGSTDRAATGLGATGLEAAGLGAIDRAASGLEAAGLGATDRAATGLGAPHLGSAWQAAAGEDAAAGAVEAAGSAEGKAAALSVATSMETTVRAKQSAGGSADSPPAAVKAPSPQTAATTRAPRQPMPEKAPWWADAYQPERRPASSSHVTTPDARYPSQPRDAQQQPTPEERTVQQQPVWRDPTAAGGPGANGASGASRPGRRRSRKPLLAVVILVIIVAVGAVLATLLSKHGGTKTAGQATPAHATGTIPPLTKGTPGLITAINTTGGAAQPNYATATFGPALTGTTDGFTMSYPASWKVKQQSGSQQRVFITAPDGVSNVEVDLTTHTKSNMVAEAQYLRSQTLAQKTFPGYKEIRLSAEDVRGTPGAIWAFYYTSPAGTLMKVEDIVFILQTKNGPQSYAILAASPNSIWQSTMLPRVEAMLKTFQPDPS